MKVYLVDDYHFGEKHIFSTLDKAKKFCYRLAEQDFELIPSNYEADTFNKDNVEFVDGKDCIYVANEFDIAIIIICEVDKD